MIHSYRDLIVWQKGIQLVVCIYKLTEKFPKEELYGLISQMRRSSVSIPSNIAEGRYRGTRADFLQFLRIAYASGAELETQLEIAKHLYADRQIEFQTVEIALTEVMKMLNAMIRSLNPVRS